MTTEPDRAQVLKMIEGGQITADDGLRLLNATSKPGRPADWSNRWLRLRITDLSTQRAKVSLSLPMTWVALGLKIGSHYHPDLAQIDVNEIMAEIEHGSEGRIAEVENLEEDERIEIYVD
ncbi:MAG TPA: hypothetical protein VIK33_08010 [Anaerolineae bacterium]